MRLITTIQRDKRDVIKQLKLLERKLDLLIEEESQVMAALTDKFYRDVT